MCSNNAQLIYQAPAVPGFSSVMVLCDDPSDQTCEKDMESLCPENFHLCSYLEFNALNDNWNTEVSSRKRPVGEIHCTSFGRTGHFTLGNGVGSSSSSSTSKILLSKDKPLNCWISTSRPQCSAPSGCDEKHVTALCCSNNLECGNGKVDTPLEECDDGNKNEDDACLNSCSYRYADISINIYQN